eukprot:GEMP01074940.1.p1 GENE.GEMP01074940.1~~GEMP01074940.1.p1  ORF type:complete len:175 (+),score=36.19 GEMP01074940.1:208-732(+)
MGCAQHRAVPTDAWPFRRFESLNVERSASDGALWDSAHWTTWMFCVDVRVKVNDKVLHCYIHEVEVVIDANAVCLTGEKWCLRCEADRGIFSIADELHVQNHGNGGTIRILNIDMWDTWLGVGFVLASGIIEAFREFLAGYNSPTAATCRCCHIPESTNLVQVKPVLKALVILR